MEKLKQGQYCNSRSEEAGNGTIGTAMGRFVNFHMEEGGKNVAIRLYNELTKRVEL